MGMDHHQLKAFASVLSLISLFVLINGDDAEVMQKLLEAISPRMSPLPYSTANNSFCLWTQVKCDSSNRVTSINLADVEYVGILPPDLNSLSQLNSLDLAGNLFSGPLPSFANLTFLQTLNLQHNNFSSIPPGSFHGLTSLTSLNLANNMNLAPWSIPSELTQSPNLVVFNAAYANLVGQLPDDFFHAFPNLTDLDLSHNGLAGTLPASLAATKIQRLWLNDQLYGFTGTIDVLSSMTHLTQVWLQKNRLSGQIPDLSPCKNLSDLLLRDNKLVGMVPKSLTQQLPSLANVSLDNNLLQGPIPEFPARVNNSFGGNNFCSSTKCDPLVSILLEIARGLEWPTLLTTYWKGSDRDICDSWICVECDDVGRIFNLNFSRLKTGGSISPAFANLTSMNNLYLNYNNLTGKIPQSLTTLPMLRNLDLSDNNLSGTVPKFAPSVWVDISGNPLLLTPP